MVRPYRFHPNPETAADNSFQRTSVGRADNEVAAAARVEFDRAVEALQRVGVTVHVIDDSPLPDKPDAVFPNNWMSTHHDGRVALYPMYSEARRGERRRDIIEKLSDSYRITEVTDYSEYEKRGQYLEGTGSLVLDHRHKIAYASLSRRTHPEPLARFCGDFDYEPVVFTAGSRGGKPVYHTNVVMCIGSGLALVALKMIPDKRERELVRSRLLASGRTLIELEEEQVASYAGNAIELHDARNTALLVMSAKAVPVLTRAQRKVIDRRAQIVPLELSTIELAGGSARCMLATIHLPAK
ncbi:MAG: amidinotransferase [Verrucomicrobia bacterium]|nr:amidinotransferase [Verrucomicrobiota bacterium]